MNDDLEQQFGTLGDEPVDEILEKSAQLHVALLELTESEMKECESFDFVAGTDPEGLEALRRLIRCWDPLSGGKTQGSLATASCSGSVQNVRPPTRLEDMGRTGATIRDKQTKRKRKRRQQHLSQATR